MTTIKSKEYEKALNYFSLNIVENKDDFKIEWIQYFQSIDTSLGDLLSFDLTEWDVETALLQKDKSNGQYYTLKYHTKFDDFDAEIILSMYKPFLRNEIKIYNFKIESEGL